MVSLMAAVKPLFCSAMVLSLAEDIHKKVRFSFLDCFVLFSIVLVVGVFFCWFVLLFCFLFSGPCLTLFYWSGLRMSSSTFTFNYVYRNRLNGGIWHVFNELYAV